MLKYGDCILAIISLLNACRRYSQLSAVKTYEPWDMSCKRPVIANKFFNFVTDSAACID